MHRASSRSSKRCMRLVLVGSFTHRDRAGVNRVRFTGRLRGRALNPGTYQLHVTAILAGRRSRQLTASFRILLRSVT